MLKLACRPEALEAWRSWRFHHPHPLGQRKLDGVLWPSQGVPNAPMPPIGGFATAPLSRERHASPAGGVEGLQAWHCHRPASALVHQRTTLEEPRHAPPPATVAAAAAQSAARTGSPRGPTPTRRFVKK
jgi:hypothetical protein